MPNTKPKAQAKAAPQTKAKTVSQSAVKAAPRPEPEAKVKKATDVTPQMVKRVHQLYEELGREEVQAVVDAEKAGKAKK